MLFRSNICEVVDGIQEPFLIIVIIVLVVLSHLKGIASGRLQCCKTFT